ncbi:MAG: PEP-CTERM sorting domain-containing protein [Akkermansia sp.]|nr:PEP-CTERM sorting domain-containing protein [Akkermansia sp.]
MKKTLITLLALAGVAAAATTTVTDLTTSVTSGNVTYTAPTTTGGEGSFSGAGIWESGGGSRAHGALTFTLNLTDLAKLTTQTNLVTVDSSDDIGLIWGQYNGEWGIAGNWQGNLWANNGTSFVSLGTLMADAWSVADNATDGFITLTMTVANTEGAQGGMQLYKAGSNTSYYTTSGLGSSNNTSIDAFKFDTSLIENVAVTSGWVAGGTASGLGSNLETTFTSAHGGKVALVPEPTTATLSLLALCGLAARRRRK